MKRIAIVAGTMFSVVACLGQQRQPNIVFILADDMGYPLSAFARTTYAHLAISRVQGEIGPG